jgi:Ni,Fe-hydrogenase III small subunit/NAD-dependent dihydropyrimidine dehydrogenase PreA subunit
MIKALLARFQQGHRTMKFPDGPAPDMPDHFRGVPRVDPTRCPDGCKACAEACPTDALRLHGQTASLDLGRCLFCTECETACPEGTIRFGSDYRLATRDRTDLMIGKDDAIKLAQALEEKRLKLFGRSLKLRQVSAGGCNACEADVNVLNTVVCDLGRFGIQFVASPRHADGLLITGAMTRNMELAIKKAYDAVPAPKLVIAVGACAISGGPYAGHPEVLNGAGALFPIDLYIPGCPPHPLTILDGLLRLLGRIEDGSRASSRASLPGAVPGTT